VSCPLCEQRKAKRRCPALGQTICSICCGTKRRVEISCPSDCRYLTAAREHPPAVVRRQQERDVALLLPTIERLTARQVHLFTLFHLVIARHRPDGFVRLSDEDVAEAAAALASTLETAARGVIYEHTPQSAPALRLMSEMTGLLADIRAEGVAVDDSDAAVTLRAIERGARETRTRAGGGETAYLSLVARLLQDDGTGEAVRLDASGRSGLIILP
jgi:hypothetical protein